MACATGFAAAVTCEDADDVCLANLSRLIDEKNGWAACGIEEPLATNRVRRKTRSSNKGKAAVGRWDVLRQYANELLLKRMAAFAAYAAGDVSKYGKLLGEGDAK